MSNETLKRCGNVASQHVRHDPVAKTVVLCIDSDEVTIGPIEDTTERKVLWANVHGIVARLLETMAETIEKKYERTQELLLAGERIVAFLRAVVEQKDYVARSITLARCLDAYDVAKRHARAPSVYQTLRDPKSLDGEPERQQAPLEDETTDSGPMR